MSQGWLLNTDRRITLMAISPIVDWIQGFDNQSNIYLAIPPINDEGLICIKFVELDQSHCLPIRLPTSGLA